MGIIITLKRDEQMDMESKEKSKWVREVLGKIGLPVESWAENLSMDDLRKLRVELKTLEIEILDDSNSGIKIYYREDLIAEWFKPNYVLRESPRKIGRDPKDRYYLEMHLNCRDVFNEE